MVHSEFLDKFEARTHYGRQEGESMLYRLLRPLAYDPGRPWPLLLFLHGAGERGKDNRRQLLHFGEAASQDEVMRRWPAFVVAPQVPGDSSWVFLQRVGMKVMAPAEPARTLRLAMEILDRLEEEFTIDRARVYITGLSMGGFGTWDALWRWPERFAAAAPVCGGGDPSKAPLFAHKPIWAFHGAADDIVPVQASRVMVEAVRKAGGDILYTEYPGVGHDSWTPTYNNPEFYEWLFAQRLPAPKM